MENFPVIRNWRLRDASTEKSRMNCGGNALLPNHKPAGPSTEAATPEISLVLHQKNNSVLPDLDSKQTATWDRQNLPV